MQDTRPRGSQTQYRATTGPPSMLRGLSGTEREGLILKGFRKYRTQHGICEKNEVETARNRLSVGLVVGAPRAMKMGTIRSPWRYDAVVRDALRPAICDGL
jgi:hypothetical protein